MGAFANLFKKSDEKVCYRLTDPNPLVNHKASLLGNQLNSDENDASKGIIMNYTNGMEYKSKPTSIQMKLLCAKD